MVLVLGLATLGYVWAFWLRRWSGGASSLVRVLPELIAVVGLLSLLGVLVGQHRAMQDLAQARERLPLNEGLPGDVAERGVAIGRFSVTAGLLAMVAAQGILAGLTYQAASRRGS